MTVAELLVELSKLDPGRTVILQTGSGGGYSPLSGIDGNAVYRAETPHSGEVKVQTLTDELRAEGIGEDDVGEGEPCVVLVPAN